MIHLQEMNTTPGKTLPLQQGGGYVSISDPDDPDSESFHYKWEMGDDSGPKTYEEALAHYYTAPGDYTLRLTVTDDDGVYRPRKQPFMSVTPAAGAYTPTRPGAGPTIYTGK